MKQQLHDQRKQYDTLLADFNEEKKAKNRLSVRHENTILDFTKTSTDQTLKDENSRLHEELNSLNIENAGLHKEVDRVRTR